MQVHTGLKAAGGSHPGLHREINEDRFHYDAARGLFIVIDGVGGQAAGEKAAETALTMVRTRLERETGAVEDRVREAIGLANNEIHRLASTRPEWKGMACVLTVAVVTNGDVVVGHVGDTRLYKLRGGRLEKLTRDHSPVGEREDAGELSEREAMQHPRRNEVYRDVGSEAHDPYEPGFIDIRRYSFEPDAALLLCSDGLTDLVPAAAIGDIVRDFAGHAYEIVRGLIDAANAAGGKDNVTIVYVEGPRFATGDDTRDLRPQRSAPGTPAPSVSPPSSRTIAAEPVESNPRRWVRLLIVLAVAVVIGTVLYAEWDRLAVPSSWSFSALRHAVTPSLASKTIGVARGESIAEAIQSADTGSEVVVEPGEYRERLALKSGVRVVSRVPRGASIRLPGGASEADPAIVAFDVTDSTLSGFRIIGDAATPLGTGVLVRNATVILNDLEISGAHRAAVEYIGASGGSITAGLFHDNPGSAIVVRHGSSPRIAHNAFERNATSERAPGMLVIEPDAHPSITANTFNNLRPDAVTIPSPSAFPTLAQDNWFIYPAETQPPRREGSSGREGRGRR
jgi:serine/threonine protein phosphatase PrpC